MAVAPSRAIAAAAVEVADHTRHLIAVRLLPFLFILYIANYLDRTSVAYAALGMSRDLGFSDRVLGLGTGVFFISYVALQIPGALLVERWSARRMISVTLIAWGSLTALTGLVHTPGQLYLARFALGAAEAGFFPGVIVYLSHWFIREDRAKATGNFMAAIPLSFVIGSPIAGWILGHSWLGFAGWRWLFVLEGMPAILLGAFAFFFLTDWPGEAAWLAPAGRQWIEHKLHDEKPVSTQAITVWQALRSRAVLGDTDRNPEPVGRGGSGMDQRGGQCCRLCEPFLVRLPAHSNRVPLVRTRPDDVCSACRRAGDPVYSPERASACPLNERVWGR